MKKILKKTTALALILALLIAVFPPVTVNAVEVKNVGALWDGFTAGSGTFTVTSSSRVYVVGTSAPTGDLLQTAQLIQRELRAQFGESYFAEMVWGDADWAKTGDIVLNLDTTSGTGADGYKLDVTATTATVTAADTDGLIYGTNNLIKCFRAVGGNSISGFSGYDSPDTKERTVHLDVARKYYTVEWICNFIRQMSWMGYNALELHTSEDGGFRADLWDPAYYTDSYRPENDFSWLCGSHVQSWVKDPYRTDPDAGKYLTTAELVQICEVAKEYHIEIIPSFDSPAHMDYITWKFEQNYKSNTSYSFTYDGTTYKASSTKGCINYTGKTGASSPSWPYYTTIDITDGTMAKAFVFALYEDMADFFKEYAGSTKFNIGADEVNLSSSYGPKWSYSQFPGYVNELNRMLNGKGYTVRIYNDFIGSTTYNQEYDTSEGISAYNSKYDFDKNIEICYWTSDFHPTTGAWSEPIWHVKFFWENNTGTTDNWGDGGRTMYNCIQTNTYYVLREGTSGSNRDARDPENRNWTFYGTNEEDIYNNWYPADISEKGVYSEDAADVPEDQLGGAYFLIWNDYAAMNTESEVWNGALDCYDGDRTYYLFDIMASNTIKMWNSDINSSVTYSKFAAVRDTFGWFPGYTSCSAEASLPAATENPGQAWAADHSALTAALEKVIPEIGNFTEESWDAYQAAIDAAEKVDADHAATQEEVDSALANLEAAEAALTEKVTVDKTDLKAALDAALTEQGSYTNDSWSVYQAAVQAGWTVYNDANATQDQVDAALAALNAARDALVENSGSDTITEESVSGSILKVEKLTKTARCGKQVGLRITTTADVEEITVEGETLTIHNGKVQTLSDLGEVKVWLIGFAADEKGTFTYNITADDTGTAVVRIQVK